MHLTSDDFESETWHNNQLVWVSLSAYTVTIDNIDIPQLRFFGLMEEVGEVSYTAALDP